MKFRRLKQVLALTLTAAMTVGGMGVPGMTASAGEIAAVDESGNTKILRGVSMEDGLSYSASEMKTSFNGTDLFEVDTDDVTRFIAHIQNKDSLEFNITFKITSAAQDNICLFEICDSDNNQKGAQTPQSTLAVIVSKAGRVYLEAGSHSEGTDWQISTRRVDDGNFHTLKITLSGEKMAVQMDNGTEQSVSSVASRNTKNFVSAFFGQSGTAYTDWRKDIDSIIIGGLKSGSYFEHNNYVNLNGEISSITIVGKQKEEVPTQNAVKNNMFSTSLDNTWMFCGGVETQGRFEEIGGIRNYIGQFEEFARWNLVSNGSDYKALQRYMINVGQEGKNAEFFASNIDTYIKKTDPKAIAYLIGPEDYNGDNGTEAFKEALGKIIDAALAMKEGNGCAVIQYPHAVQDAETNQKINIYAQAAKEVIRERNASDRERIVEVDHYEQTKDSDDFKNHKLTEEGLLNAAGHYEISKQFAQAVYGSTEKFPSITETRTVEEMPDNYLNTMPKVTASGNSLEVSVEGIESVGWEYDLIVDGVQISGKTSENPFVIGKLPEGKEYELTVRTSDGNIQLAKAAGTIIDGNIASSPILSDLQKAIRDKVDQSEESLTWLFMGDSITHGAMWLGGYDGIAQLFEKYVKEDLGRKNDIIINTACSSARANTTFEHIQERMTKYKPDIVSIMLGTNDSITEATYNNNLKNIVDEIRKVNPDALIIFRTPTPSSRQGYGNKLGGSNGAIASMKKVADEYKNILFIDQYTEWNKELGAYPYLYAAAGYYGDGNLHPGSVGHLHMTRQFIEECGLNTNTKIANLNYKFNLNYTEETNTAVKPEVTIADTKDAITVSKSDLNAKYTAGDIGEMTVILTDRDGTTFTKTAGLDDTEVRMDLPASRNYTVKAVANIKGGTAKRVTFTGDDILLATGTEKEDLESELSAQQIKYEGDLSGYTPASVQAFQTAYEAAQKALTESEDDPEVLDRCMAALAKSAAELQEKTVITGTQNVSIDGNTVSLPADVPYTASDVSWNAEKTGGSFTLTAKEDARFDSKVQVAVSNAAALSIEKVNAAVEDNKITVTFTVKAKADSDNQGQNSKPGQPGQPDQPGQPGQPGQPDQPTPVIEAGKTYDDGKYNYKVLSTADMTAEVTGVKNTDIKKVVVANSVKLGGKDYKVVSVAANAFKGNRKITSVSMKKNVKTIGKNAFAGCTRLKKVTISSTKLTTINAKAFSGCKSLKTITIRSKVLKKVGKNAFKGIHKKAVIKVPKAKRAAYKGKILKNKGQAKTVKIK